MASLPTTDQDALRKLAGSPPGLTWAVSFIVIGLGYGLQMYGDGSIFTYMAVVQDAWAFHWHNISGRMFVYLFSFVPAETAVALTSSARAGIVTYGLLQFAGPLIGLAATFALDRSKGRLFFTYACASTAALCPLVFGFPTELWLGQAVFWPALAFCHDERRGVGRLALDVALAPGALPRRRGDLRHRHRGDAGVAGIARPAVLARPRRVHRRHAGVGRGEGDVSA